MSGEGFDGCECTIWNHEFAMRRLLSLLRQGQAYCTDGECLDELPGLGPPNGSNGFLMMFLMMAFAMLLYVMRPSRLRNDGLDGKPYNGGQGPSGAPPTPPPAAN